MTTLDRLFQPVWAGGWVASRLMFGGAALWALLPRFGQIGEALQHPDIVFISGPLRLWDRAILPGWLAYATWAGALLGILALWRGSKLARPGLVLFLGCYLFLVSAMGLESRVPERAFILVGTGLLLGPIGERGLTEKWRSPAARWYVMLLACSLYGSTGWLKLLHESGWGTGEVLAYALVDRHFGLRAQGVWIGAHSWLVAPMSWYTVVFEAAFPFLVWWRRSNPWLLLMGAGMHLGIATLMGVGSLTATSLSMYPVLLHPEVAERAMRRLSRRLSWLSTRQ